MASLCLPFEFLVTKKRIENENFIMTVISYIAFEDLVTKSKLGRGHLKFGWGVGQKRGHLNSF